MELIAYAKANPGKLNIATLGGFSDLMAIMFRTAAGIDVQVVPYRGAAEAAVGVMRGDSHMALNAYSALERRSRRATARDGHRRLHRSPSTPTCRCCMSRIDRLRTDQRHRRAGAGRHAQAGARQAQQRHCHHHEQRGRLANS